VNGSEGAGRIGAWAMIPDPLMIEALARSGVDFVGIDLQHGAFDLGSAFRAIQLLDTLGVSAFVRVSQDELTLIPRVCDHGAAGIVVAMVESPEVAERAVAEARYHPDGRRSYGGQRYGMRHEPADVRDVQPEVHAMIESRPGLAAVESIANVAGLAGLHVGPVDLALGLGLGMERSGPSFDSAIDRIAAAATTAGVVATMHASWGIDVSRWRSRGFRDVILIADVAIFRTAMDREVAVARGGGPQSLGAYGRAESSPRDQ
jgi:4-hydroxy-2-oxoheptanedioate aldolase